LPRGRQVADRAALDGMQCVKARMRNTLERIGERKQTTGKVGMGVALEIECHRLGAAFHPDFAAHHALHTVVNLAAHHAVMNPKCHAQRIIVSGRVGKIFSNICAYPTIVLLTRLLGWTIRFTLCKVRNMPTPTLQPTLWRTCRVLANDTRLRLLAQLVRKQPQSVSELAAQCSLTLPIASQSLRALEARGLLRVNRIRRRVEYHIPTRSEAGSLADLIAALLAVLHRKPLPTRAIMKLATAFTHPT